MLALAACAGEDLAALRGVQPRGSSYAETLAREYRAFALQRSANGSWRTAEHFAAKGRAALAGRLPQPDPVDPSLPAAEAVALRGARERLLLALSRSAAERFPPFAAVALARFDCWAERSRAWVDSSEAVRCRREFEENMLTLEEALKNPNLNP